MPFSRCLVKLYTLIAVIWRTFLKQFNRDALALCGLVMFSASLQRTTMIYELFLWTDGEWKLAAHQMLFHAIAPAIALWLQLVRDIVSRSERWTWQGCFTMVLWCTPYYHDFGGTHSERSPGLHSGCLHAVFYWKASQWLSLHMLHCVVSGYSHTSHCGIPRYIVQTCWCAYGGPSDDPCYIRAVCFFVINTKPPRSERLSLTSDGWHGGCHPRVFLWRSQSSSVF